MGNIKQAIAFPGGLNLDDNLDSFPKGDWRGLSNMRTGVSEADTEGSVEAIRGDDQKSIATTGLPTGNSVYFLGGAKDIENKKLYHFYTVVGGADWIVEHDLVTDTFNTIFEDTPEGPNLNFHPDNLIQANVLDGILYFNDNSRNPPRKLNIAKAKEMMDQGFIGETIVYWNETTTFALDDIVIYLDGYYKSLQNGNLNKKPKDEPTWWTKLTNVVDAYSIVEEQELDVIAHPPIRPPIVNYATDGIRQSNNLRGALFQFAYRYIYQDYRKSTYSAASIIPLPQGEEELDGAYVDDVSQNNVINVFVNTGSQEVLRIEIIFRSSKDLSTWYKAGSIDVFNAADEKLLPSDTSTYLAFYNNLVPVAVSSSNVSRPFDYVPILAGSQEIIEDNTLVYGDITEGYPNTKLSIETSITTEDLSTEFPNVPISSEKVTQYNNSGPPPTYNTEVVVYMPTWRPVSYFYNSVFYISQTIGGSTKTASYTATSPDTWADIRDGLVADLGAKGMDIDTCVTTIIPIPEKLCFFQVLAHEIGAEIPYYSDKSWDAWTEVTGELKKFRNLKSNASHIAGIVYYDRAHRHGPVNTHVNTRFYLSPYKTGGTGLEFNERWKVQFTINNLPPAWATNYQLVYAPVKSYFLTLRLNDITNDGGTDNVYLEFNERLTDMRDNFKRTAIADYEWQKGDRLRFLGTLDGSVIYPANDYDFEIEKVDDAGRLVVKYFNHLVPGFGAEAGKWTVVEVYRLAKEVETTIFYEIGQQYKVLRDGNNNPYHEGDIDQTIDAQGNSLTGAIVRFLGGDSFKYQRVDSEGFYWAESMFYSDFELNGDFHSLGFAKVEDPDAEQLSLIGHLRWGGQFFIDTFTNNIAQFNFDDYETVAIKFGRIRKLIEVGYILKVIQSHKNNSFYIRRVESVNPDGEKVLSATSQMFGTKRPEKQDWGTQHPESVIRFERHIYFWDAQAGKFIRDAPNGMFAISDYKMKRWFMNFAKNYPAGVKCRTAYNEEYKELWVSFNYGSNTTKTWIFSEYKTRWIGDLKNECHGYLFLDKRLFLTYEGKLYEYNTDNNDYFNFNGVQKDGEIQVVGNEDLLKVKVWNAIALYSNYLMNAPNDGDLSIPADSNYSSGMSTRIKTAKWEAKEGVFYGEIMRDLNTPGSDPNKIVTGRLMRGRVLLIKLTTTENTEQTVVDAIVIHATPSEKSKI